MRAVGPPPKEPRGRCKRLAVLSSTGQVLLSERRAKQTPAAVPRQQQHPVTAKSQRLGSTRMLPAWAASHAMPGIPPALQGIWTRADTQQIRKARALGSDQVL